MIPLPTGLDRARLYLRERYPFAVMMAGLFALLAFHGRALTQNYYYLFLLLPFLFAVTASELRDLARNPVIVALAAYLLTLWLSMIWTGATPTTLLRQGRTLLVELLFVAQLAWLLRRDRVSAELILSLTFGACMVVAFVLSLVWLADYSFDRRLSLFMWLNPNTGAAVTGVAALLLGGAWVSCRSGKLRLLIGLLFVALLVEIVLSWSRATLVSVAVALVAILISRRSWATFLLLAIPLPLIVIAAGALGWADPLAYVARGDSARVAVWQAFWGPIRDHFWTGIGIQRQFELVFEIAAAKIDNPHNMLLVSLLYAGVLAGVAWIVLLAAMAKAAVSAMWSRPGGDPLALAMFVFILLHGLVESVLLVEMTNWQWLYLLVPIGCVARAGFRDPPPAPGNAVAVGAGDT